MKCEEAGCCSCICNLVKIGLLQCIKSRGGWPWFLLQACCGRVFFFFFKSFMCPDWWVLCVATGHGTEGAAKCSSVAGSFPLLCVMIFKCLAGWLVFCHSLLISTPLLFFIQQSFFFVFLFLLLPWSLWFWVLKSHKSFKWRICL